MSKNFRPLSDDFKGVMSKVAMSRDLSSSIRLLIFNTSGVWPIPRQSDTLGSIPRCFLKSSTTWRQVISSFRFPVFTRPNVPLPNRFPDATSSDFAKKIGPTEGFTFGCISSLRRAASGGRVSIGLLIFVRLWRGFRGAQCINVLHYLHMSHKLSELQILIAKKSSGGMAFVSRRSCGGYTLIYY